MSIHNRNVLTKTIINYTHYSNYRMASTIQLTKETKQLIQTFGSKEDTYEDIILKMYKSAVKEQLRDFLYTSEDAITLNQARDMINNA